MAQHNQCRVYARHQVMTVKNVLVAFLTMFVKPTRRYAGIICLDVAELCRTSACDERSVRNSPVSVL